MYDYRLSAALRDVQLPLQRHAAGYRQRRRRALRSRCQGPRRPARAARTGWGRPGADTSKAQKRL